MLLSFYLFGINLLIGFICSCVLFIVLFAKLVSHWIPEYYVHIAIIDFQ